MLFGSAEIALSLRVSSSCVSNGPFPVLFREAIVSTTRFDGSTEVRIAVGSEGAGSWREVARFDICQHWTSLLSKDTIKSVEGAFVEASLITRPLGTMNLETSISVSLSTITRSQLASSGIPAFALGIPTASGSSAKFVTRLSFS